ncbi:glycine betaine ABC transporter substrate-binding protein, partial [Klebsiella pneumoniae]|uniref:glycine betaine ABC transporter substrate-binding protein n=1 Tax=Klebsiella pneumoniae TaxID=573 RepID=UPI003A5CAB12
GLSKTVTHNQGNYAAMMADTIARYKEGKPVLYYTWTPYWVSDDVHGVHREAIVGAVGQFGVDVLLLARQGGERHLQPDDVL